MKLRLFEIAAGGVRSAAHRLQSYQTRGYGQTGDDAGSERDDDVPFVGQPIGFASRPVIRRGLRALGLVGDDDSVSLLTMIDRAIEHATEVAEGEARVFSPQATAVCVRVGPVSIEVRVESGGLVKLAPDVGEVQLAPGGVGYAGQSVARNGDSVNPSAAMVTWMAAVNAAIPMPSPVPPATIGTITGSASRAKA